VLAELLGQTQLFISMCKWGQRRLDLVDALAFCVAKWAPFRSLAAGFDKEVSAMD
jgi:hypothetical protein